MPFGLLIQIAPIVVLLVLGFTVGTLVERAHFRRLEKREAAVRDIFVTNLRKLPTQSVARAYGLVTGEVVIASDYFKTFAATLRKLVGGELHAFESLMVRARRDGPESSGKDKGYQYPGQGQYYVHDPHQQCVDLSSGQPADQANEGADNAGSQRGKEQDDERNPTAVYHPAEDVAALEIGAHQVAGAAAFLPEGRG